MIRNPMHKIKYPGVPHFSYLGNPSLCLLQIEPVSLVWVLVSEIPSEMIFLDIPAFNSAPHSGQAVDIS